MDKHGCSSDAEGFVASMYAFSEKNTPDKAETKSITIILYSSLHHQAPHSFVCVYDKQMFLPAIIAPLASLASCSPRRDTPAGRAENHDYALFLTRKIVPQHFLKHTHTEDRDTHARQTHTVTRARSSATDTRMIATCSTARGSHASFFVLFSIPKHATHSHAPTSSIYAHKV